jgi:hypothetical protein
MSWKYEESLEEETGNGPVPVSANLLGNAQLLISYKAVEVHPRRIFGSLSPIVNIDSVGLENGDAKYTPSASNSPHTRIDG